MDVDGDPMASVLTNQCLYKNTNIYQYSNTYSKCSGKTPGNWLSKSAACQQLQQNPL